MATFGHTAQKQEPSYWRRQYPPTTSNCIHSMTYSIGPVAKPSTYSETPRMPTSCETPNFTATTPMAVEKMLEPNAAVSVTYPSTTATISFFVKGQF